MERKDAKAQGRKGGRIMDSSDLTLRLRVLALNCVGKPPEVTARLTTPSVRPRSGERSYSVGRPVRGGCSTITVVRMPPRGVKSAVIFIQRGWVAATRSSRRVFVTFS